MAKITYKDRAQYSSVLVEGRVVGHIMRTLGGQWFYLPKGVSAKEGERMKNRADVKKSIEEAQ